jgi:hypothetical protein
MVFDKERVFNYYNDITYDIKNGRKYIRIPQNGSTLGLWQVSILETHLRKQRKYLNPSGKYLLDIASGPIGLKEYLELSENFEYRICADIFC